MAKKSKPAFGGKKAAPFTKKSSAASSKSDKKNVKKSK